MRVIIIVILAFVIQASSLCLAGDAVAAQINGDGSYDVTHWESSTRKGGSDYKNSVDAASDALRTAKAKGWVLARVIHDSDLTGYFCVAGGMTANKLVVIHVGYGADAAEAKRKVFAELSQAGASLRQTVIETYFSYGDETPAASSAR